MAKPGLDYERKRVGMQEVMHCIKDGGFMIFHDTCNPAWPGVKQAVDEFLEYTKDKWDRYDWFNCNGLLVLRLRIED